MANPAFYYDNRLDDGTPAASTTAAGDFNVLNLRDWRPYSWWKPTAMPATVTVDCGSAKASDYMLLYAEAGSYECRGSTDNFSASDVLLGTLVLTETTLALLRFNSASYRWWRLRMTGSVRSVAICSIGAALNMPVGLMSGDFRGRKTEGRYASSMKGLPLGRLVDFESFSETLRFRYVDWSWERNTWEPAWDAHLAFDPFVFAWDPANYPNDLLLVGHVGGFDYPQTPGGRGDLSLALTGVFL